MIFNVIIHFNQIIFEILIKKRFVKKMSEDKDKKPDDFIKKLSQGFEELFNNIFSEETVEKISEFTSDGVKNIVEFGDQLIETLKLQDNELVKKSSDGIKDLLKQAGLLKDEEEDDF